MTTDTTYLRHFAFTRFPFAANLQADELFASGARREAVARLKHLLELRGIGLLTGEVGCGKTTVCRLVTANLHPGLVPRLLRLPHHRQRPRHVQVHRLATRPAHRTLPRHRLTAPSAPRSPGLVQESKLLPVLIVDEAQFLRNDVLDDLRLLNQLRHGLRTPSVSAVGGAHRAPPPPVHGRSTNRSTSASSCATTSAASPATSSTEYLTHRLRLAGSELPVVRAARSRGLVPGRTRSATSDQPHRSLRPLGCSSRPSAHTVNHEHLQRALDDLRP